MGSSVLLFTLVLNNQRLYRTLRGDLGRPHGARGVVKQSGLQSHSNHTMGMNTQISESPLFSRTSA